MTKKLGVLLTSKRGSFEYVSRSFTIRQSYFSEFVKQYAYKCTEEEAREDFPQFRWIPLEELK
ncbi:hypothetical protein [Streptococcus ruminantium]|uniref:hypothetical protein n=1 Tax=Streptococcus ruminantium TaxID=1917441 RepID=UPI0012DEDBD7|nr:hypothetical protein [Streptococcus ruminantium]